VADGPEVEVVSLCGKKGMGWAAGLVRRRGKRLGFVFFFLLFQPFTHKIFSSFQKKI
jgi:hypothetical protein